MAITLTAQGKEPLPTGEYRVELTAIELSDGPYGEQLPGGGSWQLGNLAIP
jgi:hypothetical protein